MNLAVNIDHYYTRSLLKFGSLKPWEFFGEKISRSSARAEKETLMLAMSTFRPCIWEEVQRCRVQCAGFSQILYQELF